MKEHRFWEIDSVRGIAIILMVFYHLAYDIRYFSGIEVFSGSLFWFIFPRITASAFILLVGVSLSLSHMRDPSREFRHYMQRGVKIFLGGMLITAVTWLFVPSAYITFGALHFIGASIILGYFFLGRGIKNVYYSAICITAGLYLSTIEVSYPYLLWLGLAPQGYTTLDYFPLVPYFGIVLLGIYLGETFYAGYERKIKIIDRSRNALFTALTFLGRHSLLIYFLHQPIILAGLYLAGLIPPGSLS